MNTQQIWTLLVILFIGIIGYLGLNYWMAVTNNTIAEKKAWISCIKENDQGSAGNLVCRSLYPQPYALFYKEFNQ